MATIDLGKIFFRSQKGTYYSARVILKMWCKIVD